MPRKTRGVQPGERAAELLAAATELLRTHGCAGTAMADISAAAGVARGSVNWHYSPKDDIFAAVMGRTPIKRASRRNLDMGSTGRNELPSSVGPASTGAPTPQECVGAPGTDGFTATG